MKFLRDHTYDHLEEIYMNHAYKHTTKIQKNEKGAKTTYRVQYITF